MRDYLRVRTIDEMVAELKGMELKLYMSTEELRELNTALNLCIVTG